LIILGLIRLIFPEFLDIFQNNFNILLLPLFIYLDLNILSSIYESVKNKDLVALFFLPFIFLIIHLSYGGGMIHGYLKKIF